MMSPHGPQQGWGWPQPPQIDPERQKAESRVKTLAWVQLGLAALGLYGAASGALPPKRDPIALKLHDAMWSGEFGTWLRVSTAVSLVLAALLAAAGWALLKHNRHAARLTKIHAATSLVVHAVSFVVTQLLIDPVIASIARDFGPAGEIFSVSFRVALVAGSAFGLALPIGEWWIITRPPVVALLAERAGEPRAG